MGKKNMRVLNPKIRGTMMSLRWRKVPKDDYISPLDDGRTYPFKVAGGSDREEVKREKPMNRTGERER